MRVQTAIEELTGTIWTCFVVFFIVKGREGWSLSRTMCSGLKIWREKFVFVCLLGYKRDFLGLWGERKQRT